MYKKGGIVSLGSRHAENFEVHNRVPDRLVELFPLLCVAEGDIHAGLHQPDRAGSEDQPLVVESAHQHTHALQRITVSSEQRKECMILISHGRWGGSSPSRRRDGTHGSVRKDAKRGKERAKGVKELVRWTSL